MIFDLQGLPAVVDLHLFVDRSDRLGANYLAAARGNQLHRDVGIRRHARGRNHLD